MKVFDYRNHPTLVSAILLIVVGILLNVIPARLALALGIPLYLDCTGTIITAMLGGNLPAVIVGFASNAINGISEPETMYYGVITREGGGALRRGLPALAAGADLVARPVGQRGARLLHPLHRQTEWL